MNNKYNKQLKSVFEGNPKEDSLLITEDGQIFLPRHKNLCNEYAKREGGSKRKAELTITEVKRTDFFAKKTKTTTKNKK